MSRIASSSSPAAVEPDARELEALLVDLRRVRRDAARHLAADLDPVRDRHRERDELLAVEDRPDEAHVARVRAALVRVVGHVDVPGPHRLEAELADRRLDLRPERPREEGQPVRLRHDLRAPVGDAAGEVEHLVHDRAHARPREHDRHLVRGRVELVLQDLQREGVRCRPGCRGQRARRLGAGLGQPAGIMPHGVSGRGGEARKGLGESARIVLARGYSSAGRAPGSHPGGRRFEPG